MSIAPSINEFGEVQSVFKEHRSLTLLTGPSFSPAFTLLE